MFASWQVLSPVARIMLKIIPHPSLHCFAWSRETARLRHSHQSACWQPEIMYLVVLTCRFCESHHLLRDNVILMSFRVIVIVLNPAMT
jgi:hypothetical protein